MKLEWEGLQLEAEMQADGFAWQLWVEETPGEAFKLVKQFPNGDRVVVEQAQLVRNHLVDYNSFLTELVGNIKR
jgi:hypothetical protein